MSKYAVLLSHCSCHHSLSEGGLMRYLQWSRALIIRQFSRAVRRFYIGDRRCTRCWFQITALAWGVSAPKAQRFAEF